MYEFKLDQTIWYIVENKIHSAPVLSRASIENMHEDIIANSEQEKVFARLGPSGNYYVTIHCVINEKKAFKSKDALLLHYSEFNKIFMD